MRDTDRTDCRHYSKMHLWRLPNLNMPQFRVENPSKRILMLIPIFQKNPGRQFIAESGAISAIWAKHSWLKNTDAIENGIEIKFYLEDQAKAQAMPTFEANGIDMEDIILFNGVPFEGVPHNVFGKKCAAFTDMRFRDYDWILQIDCDVFAMSMDGDKLLFFESFFQGCVEGEIGNLYCLVQEPPPSNWFRSILPPDTPIGECQAEWRRRSESLIGKENADKFWDPDAWTLAAGGGMHAFPAKHFMQHRLTDVEWFANAAQTMQDDEAVIALWHAKGNPVWNIKDKLEFPYLMIAPHISWRDYEGFQRLTKSKTPFIFHYSTNPVETLWRIGIGADK